ncbi:MAG TPA: uroporphyrinogen-III synthase [Acidimicrobiia bacterium]|nr:uroporphyrinogen-III synthase [Acidimicrobiia bacterium]
MLRVGVTTTSDGFPRWARALSNAGFEPVALPCIEIRPTDELPRARSGAAKADLLLITSARTVAFLWPDGGMPPTPVAAVGPATAQAVTNAGGLVSITGRGDSDALIDGLAGHLTGRTILFPGAAGTDAGRAVRLTEMGAEVDVVPVYETLPIAPAGDPVDGTCFASPSAVRGWLLSRTFEELGVVAAIGPVTAAELERHGVTPIEPTVPSLEALASALSATLERSS